MKKLLVIKTGGHVLDDVASLMQFLDLFAAIKEDKILVHGGGTLASRISEQMHVPVHMTEGRRITDADTLKIITMVYAGYINKNLTAQLQARSCNAMGLTGADGNLIKARKRLSTTIDYGFAGDIESVKVTMLGTLLALGITPVIAPLTHDGKGQLLNTNADTVAQEIAKAMSNDFEVTLIYCFEKEGVLKHMEHENSTIPFINKDSGQQLIAQGIIHSGMLPKISNAFRALEQGVHTVIIGKWDRLHDMITGRSGTHITLHAHGEPI